MKSDFVTPSHLFTAACWDLRFATGSVEVQWVTRNGIAESLLVPKDLREHDALTTMRQTLWIIGLETERRDTRHGGLCIKPVKIQPRTPDIEVLDECMQTLEQWIMLVDQNCDEFGEVFAQRMREYSDWSAKQKRR